MKSKIYLFLSFIIIVTTNINCNASPRNTFATITKYVDAKEYRGKEIKFEAFVKVDAENKKSTGNLWVRVDLENKEMGFFNNMAKNPIKANKWKSYEIIGKVNDNALYIYFGCFLSGKGNLWVDDLKLSVKENGTWKEIEIPNSSFEEIEEDNKPKDWYCSPSKTYNLITDNKEFYSGKRSMSISSINKDTTTPEYKPVSDSLKISLPYPKHTSDISIEETLLKRRSVRAYKNEVLSLAEVSQMLWSAYGISDSIKYDGYGLRTAPSAGALYPLEIYLVVGNVDGLEKGVYKYLAKENKLLKVIEGDVRSILADASYGQMMIERAPASIFYSAVYERTTKKYGK